MAKTHMFFRPTRIEDGVLASSFRGRGLLARKEEEADELNTESYPLLLSLDNDQIQVKVPITNFVEWHHEHKIKSMKYKHQELDRVQIAKEWIEISKSVRAESYVQRIVGVIDVRILWFKTNVS